MTTEDRSPRRSVPVHPILFAIALVSSTLLGGWGEVAVPDLWVPLLLTVILTLVVWAVASIAFADVRRGALLASAELYLFMTFGLVASGSRIPLFSDGAWISPHLQLAVWAGLGLLILVVVRRMKQVSQKLEGLLNLFSTLLVVISIAVLLRDQWGVHRYRNAAPVGSSSGPAVRGPDIYWIVLDGYGSRETLERVYGHDNGPFLDSLRSLGFQVLDGANANYAQTMLSIASAMNMRYLDDVPEVLGSGSENRRPLYWLIQNSELVRVLKHHGYSVLAFDTGYPATSLRRADRYISSKSAVSEFPAAVLQQTPIPWAFPRSRLFTGHRYRQRVLTVLDSLPVLARSESPKFVFAHMVTPHGPFVFDSAGAPLPVELPVSYAPSARPVDREEYIDGYVGQLRFISDRVLSGIAQVLENSAEPPIIVLQSDHGPGLPEALTGLDVRQRMGILNAAYLPGHVNELATRTPVNTFRYIATRYLGEAYPPLEERSYFSLWMGPYEWNDVTEALAEDVSSTAEHSRP